MTFFNQQTDFLTKTTLAILFLVGGISGCESLNNSTVRNSEGVGYYSQGQYDQAVAVFQEAIELDPNNADAYYNMASTYQQQANQTQQSGLLVQAENYYRLCLEHNPSSETTICCYRGLANVLNQRNQGDLALETLRQWESRNPNSIEPKLEIAYLLEAQGKYQDAIAELQTVATAAPNDYRAFYKSGVLYEKTGNPENAVNNYLTASRLNPTDSGIARNISVLQAQISNGTAFVATPTDATKGSTSESNASTSGQPETPVVSQSGTNGASSQTNNILATTIDDRVPASNSASVANTRPEISFDKTETPANAAPNLTKDENGNDIVWIGNARSEVPADGTNDELGNAPSYSTPLTNSAPATLPPSNGTSSGLSIPDGTGSSAAPPSGSSGTSPGNSGPAANSSANPAAPNATPNATTVAAPSTVSSNATVGKSGGTLKNSFSPTRNAQSGEIGVGPPKISLGAPF